MGNRKYPMRDVKLLYAKAAGRCSFPDCRRNLILEETSLDRTKQIGKIAHIVDHSSNSIDPNSRADKNYPKDKLDTYENWILVCPTCHDTIDGQPGAYPTEYLRSVKEKHEEWVQKRLETESSTFGFAELEVTLKGIAQLEERSSLGFIVISPMDKIAKNKLTAPTQNLLTMGLMRSREVASYLSEMDKLNNGYADRITESFKRKYEELNRDGLQGDALFSELHTFASNGSSDFTIMAAGLALLSHLFEICEVFEK